MASQTRPSSITGGCLCGSVRYTVDFPDGADWPPKRSCTCQCTQCRKATGTLLPQMMVIPASAIRPPLRAEDPSSTALSTYRLYRSSPRARRGFCTTCGSTLTYISEAQKDIVDLFVGTLDEEVLIGKVVEEEKEDEYGKLVRREGGWGQELGRPECAMFLENAIPGVTDGALVDVQPKYLTDDKGKKSFGGGLKDIGRA